MKDNKLYSVLATFDKVEQNRLRKYVRSPYFNVNETLMSLFDIVVDNINKNGKAEDLTKETIWKRLFNTEGYNDVRYRKLFSDLLKLIEGFLAQEIYDDNSLLQANNLLEAIGRKKVEKLYDSSIRQTKLLTEQQYLKPSNYYYYQYLIEKNYYELYDVDLKRAEKSNIEKIINNLDEFFLSEKLRWYISLLSRKSLVSHEYHLLFIDEIIEHIRKHGYNEVPAVSVYFQTVLTMTESENVNHYYKLIKLLEEFGSHFPPLELYSLYNTGLNYCIQKLNQGQQEFVKEYHELFKLMIDKDIAFYASSSFELSPWDFKNAIQSALRLGEYDWTEKFINNYKEKLPVDFRENAVSYNLALVYFYQKKYDNVISLLQSVEYEDLTYSLGSKSMLLAIYFERDEDDALLSLMDSFKTYLNRHKEISEVQRTLYLNYIKYIRKLLKLNPGDTKEIDKIKAEIEEDKKVGIASLRWIMEKLEELS